MASFSFVPHLFIITQIIGVPTHKDFQPTTHLMQNIVAHTTLPAIADNPLLASWEGPYGGIPPFDRVEVNHFKPALEAAMEEKMNEIQSIASNPGAPDFKNTIEALEAAGRTYTRVYTIYTIWSSNMSTPAFQAVESEMEPRIAAFNDSITQNQQLFKRIEAVYKSPAKSKLTPEQQRLTWRHYTNFVRAGARLTGTAREQLSAIN